MWAMRLNIVGWCYFKMQTLQGILKTQNQHQAEFCAFLEVEHLYRSVGSARSKRQCRTGIWFLKYWQRPKEYQTNPSTRETGVETQITPKIEQVLDQNVDLSNIDQVPSNAHLPKKESQLYIFEDNEAVIKMIIKGRRPTMEHVSRTHRVGYLDRINLDPKVQIKYVESRNQLADILTKRQFYV